jgi:hypothetical protein
MSAIFDDIVDKIEHLSAEERDIMMDKLRAEAEKSQAAVTVEDEMEKMRRRREELVTKFIRPSAKTEEERKERISKFLTAEEIAELETFDFDSIPQGEKSLSQMINEDREDRL